MTPTEFRRYALFYLGYYGALGAYTPYVSRWVDSLGHGAYVIGTVLALIARGGRAGLAEFDAALQDPAVASFRDRVEMQLDEEVDNAYPNRWIGKVTVHTHDGRTFEARVDEPKGDPGNTLSRPEIEDKTLRLGVYAGAASEAEVRTLIDTIWNLERLERVGTLMPA